MKWFSAKYKGLKERCKLHEYHYYKRRKSKSLVQNTRNVLLQFQCLKTLRANFIFINNLVQIKVSFFLGQNTYLKCSSANYMK